MCEFLSWVEKRSMAYFLTGEQLFSEKGQVWVEEHGISPDDYCGHGTIRKWYMIDSGDGVDKECTDFSSPDNFPPAIVRALKDGKFKGFLFLPELLRKRLSDDYWAKRKPLDDDYWAKRKPLDDGYEAKLKLLCDGYEAKLKPLDDDYGAKRKLLYDGYEAKKKPLNDGYEAKRKPLDDDYWALFAIPENRSKAWM